VTRGKRIGGSGLGKRQGEQLPPAAMAAHPPSVCEAEDDGDAGGVEGMGAGEGLRDARQDLREETGG
jgi:hypothetical protein